ncbi:hypothetical protein ACW5EG_06380 [Luteimonas sp. A611]
MSLDAARLYALLPAIHRIRDAAEGEPLRDLVALFARELEALEEDLEQLYDDQFVETCADWVVPYIGDLIGYRPLAGIDADVASPRAEVANTIAYRRRKGTALMLEQLAADLTGWPAHVAEFFEQLATTQYMKHLRPHAPATADLRSQAAMRALGGAFNTTAHTPDMRRPQAGADRGGGRYNIPNIGIFLWRLLPLPLSSVPLVPHPGDASGTRFRLNPLGADLALFRRPRSEASIATLSAPSHVAAPLDVRGMAAAVRATQALPADAQAAADDDDYGPGESLVLLRPGAEAGSWQPVPVAQIVVADLRDVGGGGWNHQDAVPDGVIAIDPERGRIVLGADVELPLRASFHYGFARRIGGGEYERVPDGETLVPQQTASDAEDLQPHLDAIAGGGRLLIGDSLGYAAPPQFQVDAPANPDASATVVVAARNSARPLLVATGDITLDIGAAAQLVLEGLVLSGGALVLPAAADDARRTLVLRHCTLVPGISLLPDGSADSPDAPSLVIEHPFASVRLEHCITGGLRAAAGAEVEIVDSIVDAGAPASVAYAAPDGAGAGGTLMVRGSTIVGKLHARIIELASDTIFHAALAEGDDWIAPVRAQRTQQGCVRFCWLPPDSIAPRRYRCLPDDAHPGVRPHFNALRYGQPAYMQLRASTPAAIPRGASDEGEIGVMHALAQPQREANLHIRLDEYLRHGLRAGIFHAT